MIACRHGHENTTLFLLKNGADPNQRADNGHTAVHEACRSLENRFVRESKISNAAYDEPNTAKLAY